MKLKDINPDCKYVFEPFYSRLQLNFVRLILAFSVRLCLSFLVINVNPSLAYFVLLAL